MTNAARYTRTNVDGRRTITAAIEWADRPGWASIEGAENGTGWVAVTVAPHSTRRTLRYFDDEAAAIAHVDAFAARYGRRAA